LRPMQILRKSRLVQLGVGALMLAIPASAVALSAGHANALSAPIQITLDHQHVTFGRAVRVTGSISPSAAGQGLTLQFAVPHGAWRSVAATSVSRTGNFRFKPTLRQTGLLRVVGSGSAATSRSAPSPTPVGGAAVAPSPAQRVSVAGRFSVATREFSVLGGQAVHVRGRLLPAASGRRIQLVGGARRSWHRLASARTSGRGGFDLRYVPGSTGQQWLRVRFSGDRHNARAWARAGRVTSFRPSLASWFTDAGSTACGFHAYYGVANKSLPCGTKVTFRYGGRSVTATVEDRGPYAGGREWDLNQNTAAALGFDGVGTVWSSI
jgi:rare lipoprotein A